MATRPSFLVIDNLVKIETFDFKWHAGLAKTQKQKSINELHTAIHNRYSTVNILEVSSKSKEYIGKSLSAFNLLFRTDNGNKYSVETLFQSSKVFKNGGPYTDLLMQSSLEAKKDIRLKSSGELMYFKFFTEKWDLIPQTAFYDWVYINALVQNKHLVNNVIQYNCFTDIEFNPKKSINCQAYSLALFVSLYKRNLLKDVLKSKDNYLNIVAPISKEQKQIESHLSLF